MVSGIESDPRPETARIACLGQFRVDLQTWEISGENRRARLQEKPFLVLSALLERPGELVTRSELRRRLWNDGEVVDFDNNLNTAVATLRTALRDSAHSPELIETLPRKGYRLIAEVNFEAPHSEPEREAKPRRIGRGEPLRRKGDGVVWFAVSMGAAVVVLAAAGYVFLGASANRLEGLDVLSGPATRVQSPKDPAARKAWQRGLYIVARGSIGDRTLALESFREVLRHASGFAPAHVRIAETLSNMSFDGSLEIRQGLEQARVSASRALALDETSAAAHRIHALANLHLDWDFSASGRDLESALRIDPRDAQNYLAAATFLSAAGQSDAAVLAVRRAVALDPASFLLKADLGYFLVAAGHYTEALEVCRETLEIDPDFIHAHTATLIAAERLGRFEESLVAARRIMELRGGEEEEIQALGQSGAVDGLSRFRRWDLAMLRSRANDSFFSLALKHAALHQKEEALTDLERAFEGREPRLVYLHGYAQFDGMRDDPRFIELVSRLGAPDPSEDLVTRILARIAERS